IDAVWGALKDAQDPQIHIVLSVSDVHIDRKLGMTRAQVLKRGAEMVEYARFLCDKVEYSPEDAGRADPDYLIETVETMIAAGATVINIPDTTGYCLPHEFGGLVRRVITEARGSDSALFSVHCHNDLGLAVANTLAAIEAGARRVECTINGIGERAGRHAFHHRLSRLGITLAEGKDDAAWQRFLQLADTKKEVTYEDLRKIAAMAETNGHEGYGHPPVTDQLHDHNHVADAMRHLIFG